MRHLNPAIQIFFGDRTKHVGGIAGKSRTFATEVMIHPLLPRRSATPSSVRRAPSYQLNLAHLIARGPGADASVPAPRRAGVEPGAAAAPGAAAGVDRRAGRLRRRERRDPRRAGQPPLGRTSAIPPTHEIADAVMRAGSAVDLPGLDDPRRRRQLDAPIAGGAACTSATRSAGSAPRRTTTSPCRRRSRATLPRRCQEVLGYAVHDAMALNGGYLGMVVAARSARAARARARSAAIARRPDAQARPKARRSSTFARSSVRRRSRPSRLPARFT